MSLTYGFCLGEESTIYSSAQFSDVFHALLGDGITPYGAKFSMTINGMTLWLAPGFALAAGRWAENSEQLSLPLRASGNHTDRTDAVVVRVDYGARKAYIEVLQNVDVSAIREDPSILRSEDSYSLALYFIDIHRGATTITPTDVTDLRDDTSLCGYVTPLAEASESVLTVYRFLTSGLTDEAQRLETLIHSIQQRADAATEGLTAEIQATGAAPSIGELLVTAVQPVPTVEWLLCTGGPVPTEYPILSELLSGTLPNIQEADERFRTYIYGGVPTEVL